MSALTLLEPSVADVFITGELARRAPKKVDCLQEKLALQDLASRMADEPEAVLPRFVDLAMDQAHTCGKLVTAPAWPAHPAWLAQFLQVLGTRIEL